MTPTTLERFIAQDAHEPPGRPCFCGTPGWMPGVEHIPISWSIKHGAGAEISLPSGQFPDWIESRIGKMQPLTIIDHIMVGHLSTMVDWALNRGSSIRKIIAHFGIDSKPASWSGQLARIVQFWPVNSPGIHVSSLNNPTSRVALAKATLSYGANLYSVGKEHAGTSVDLKNSAGQVILRAWDEWPTAMTLASLRVDRWLYAECPSLGAPSVDSLTGHYEYDARNRINDPVAEGERHIWPRTWKLQQLAPAGELTAEQAQMVAYLRSPDGRALDAVAVRHYLKMVGLTSLPAETPAAEAAASPTTYTVRPGDVLSVIAQRYGLATSQLASWNGIANANLIEVGQVLRLTAPAPKPVPVPEAPKSPPPGTPAAVRAEIEALLDHAAEDLIKARQKNAAA